MCYIVYQYCCLVLYCAELQCIVILRLKTVLIVSNSNKNVRDLQSPPKKLSKCPYKSKCPIFRIQLNPKCRSCLPIKTSQFLTACVTSQAQRISEQDMPPTTKTRRRGPLLKLVPWPLSLCHWPQRALDKSKTQFTGL